MAFEDLLWTAGQDNLAGLVGEMYACPSADINTLPGLTSASSLVTAAVDITCKTGKKFTRIYFTDETAKMMRKPLGDRDGKARESLLTFKYPGDDVAVEDFISDWQNTPSVIIFKDGKTGKFKLIGVTRLDKASTVLSLEIPAYLEQADSDSGEKRADSRGTLFGWKFSCAHGPITYLGSVPLVAAP